jgi:hypothetical protein
MSLFNMGSRRNPIFDRRMPKYQRYIIYCTGLTIVCILTGWIMRDTDSVKFVPSKLTDMDKPRGEMATSKQIKNVHWRVSTRLSALKLEEACSISTYTVLTHKNIVIDGEPMRESMIFLCRPIAGIRSVLNVRAVAPHENGKIVHCLETYANKTKKVPRKYPFSLKYISSATFEANTRVVRDAEEACIWLHAIDIVESIWD